AGQAMKVFERDRALAARPGHPNDCGESRQCDAHVGGVHRDAMLARAENRVIAREAADRRTPGPRYALVAWRGVVVKVRAARSLHQVAPDRGHVASCADAPARMARDSNGYRRSISE